MQYFHDEQFGPKFLARKFKPDSSHNLINKVYRRARAPHSPVHFHKKSTPGLQPVLCYSCSFPALQQSHKANWKAHQFMRKCFIHKSQAHQSIGSSSQQKISTSIKFTHFVKMFTKTLKCILIKIPVAESDQERNPKTRQSIRLVHLRYLSVVTHIPPKIDHTFAVALHSQFLQK